MKIINIAKDFSSTPGGRYVGSGEFSGQEFREKMLEPLFHETPKEVININLDGVAGYPTSFLEEAFGGLARVLGKEKTDMIFEYIDFISDEEPFLIEEIKNFIRKGANSRYIDSE